MATFFPNSNNQRDETPMLYMREPLSNSYGEESVLPGNMMMYMNYSSSSGQYSDTLAGNSQHQISCIDIPPMGVSDSNPSQEEILPNHGRSRLREHDFSSWRDGRNEMPLMHPMVGVTATSTLQGGQNVQSQGLSLSLGTHIPSGMQMASIQYQNPNSGEVEGSQNKQSRNAEYIPPSFSASNPDSLRADISPYGMSTGRTIPNNKYLNAAQQLLDEVVNVRRAMKQHDSKKELMKDYKEVDENLKNGNSTAPANGESSNPQESSSNSPIELSTSEKQDLQNKMTKLLSMLDEVDRRYKQYFHQMQIVVSSFDIIAGCGAAKPYTALALQTISRHFRCLRDAINGQIQVTRKSLGEQDASASSKGVGISRLRYVDQQIRQQRVFQQFGMMQQHAWRPQRGLPESSVSILRAWLFEHFLHPYPKDSDKILLARQTGLTRSQVSNWFINARVRLWKPMVEEMYKEETGDAEMDSNSSSEIAPKATKGDAKGSSEDGGEDLQQTATSTATERCSTGQFFMSKSNNAHDVEMMGPSTDSSFQNVSRGETETAYGIGKHRGEEDQMPNEDDYSFFPNSIVQSSAGSERFITGASAAYHISQLGRFGSGNGVSLTLGLQHCEGGRLPMAIDTQHGFVTIRGDEVYSAAASSVGPATIDYDCLDSRNRQHRFGPPHLLHDFVA